MSTTFVLTDEKKIDSVSLQPKNDEPVKQELPQWTVPEKKTSQSTAFWVAINALMTIAVVFLNKYTFQDAQMRKAQTFMAAWHFAATFMVLFAATRRPWRMFKPVRLPVIQVIPLSSFFAAFLVLNNLSLANNPVGFYQFSKILTTPCVVFLGYVLLNRTISRRKLLAVLITCAGASLATVSDISSNPVGIITACAAFTTTAAYQIWIGKKLSDLKVEAPQLLLNQAAAATILLLPVACLLDVVPDFSIMPQNTIIALAAGGVIASLINLSQFFIIGNTSALTFNIASQIKMLLILGLGWYSESKQFSPIEMAGIALALTGAWLYIFRKDKPPQ